MRVVGEFNKISDELKAKIKPLAAGQFAEYQLLEKVTTTDPVSNKREVRYPHRQWYAHDTIFDAGKGTTVEIGVIAAGGIDHKNNVVTLTEKFEFDRPRDGILVLDGNITLHRELHEFLQLCNHTKDGVLGEDRDRDKEEYYILIDRTKEAKNKNKAFDTKADALIYVRNMDAEDMRNFAAAMNWDYKGDLEEIASQIREFADKDPISFTRAAEDPKTKKKAIIRKAIGIMITEDLTNHRILWRNGTVLATLERKPGQNILDAFAEWLDTVANGDKILDQLRKAKKPAAATA